MTEVQKLLADAANLSRAMNADLPDDDFDEVVARFDDLRTSAMLAPVACRADLDAKLAAWDKFIADDFLVDRAEEWAQLRRDIDAMIGNSTTAIAETVPAVPEQVLTAIKSLAIEMRIDGCLTDTRIEYGSAEEIEAHQRWRVTQALEDLERASGLRAAKT